ncbi:hypothetical protein L226DRAFT_614446 [Lentinus tigrinus ALCF2SS1-7]|uniref:HNH nuclease domain-containing protein n=1 Tax=Lentinus tigrinus ALCF2SS1-6 TaxID=1328759 RepID=A0A5C2S470_9APHY|nr:hypothetical protein L227DRAFT_655003 [Lentinus tigrinus ALCF2SS1-6]RPD72864.1 hypothetical protein L226DRAFT_614446 [Lentinus tigrinus ALCF2SS1-7]
MSTFIIRDGKISYQCPPYHRIAGNPTHRNMAALDYPDSESSVSSQDPARSALKTLRKELLRKDMHCFVSGTCDQSLQVAHICNAVKNDPARKIDVEKLLTFFGFGEEGFQLDSIQNSMLLESNLHIPWDQNAAFALVPQQNILDKIRTILVTCNGKWQEACKDENLPNARPANADPFTQVAALRPFKWRLLVLHPAAILTVNKPLMLLSPEARAQIVNSGGEYIPTVRDWREWCLHPYEPFLVPVDSSENPSPLDELLLPDLAHRGSEATSVFAMLLNAHTKLQFYMQTRGLGTSYLAYRRRFLHSDAWDVADSLITTYAHLVSTVVNSILYTPKGCELPVGVDASLDDQPGGYPAGDRTSQDQSGDASDSEMEEMSSHGTGGSGGHTLPPRVANAIGASSSPAPSPPLDASLTTSGTADSDEGILAHDRMLVESDTPHDHGKGKGKGVDDTVVTKDSEHSPEATTADFPDHPEGPPEKEIDGFTDTEWSMLKRQVFSRDPAVATNALMLMACNTSYQLPDGPFADR